MPRRPTATCDELPLFLVPHIIRHAVRQHGEEIEWMEARRTQNHFYTVKVRTRPVNREFQAGRAKEHAGKRTGEGMIRGRAQETTKETRRSP